MTAKTLATGSLAIAYYRVSTAKQGQSGLGLDAQRAAVQAFVAARGLTLGAEFTEIETGTAKRRRPELGRALDQARRSGATLLVAKLDRLSRSVAFISTLMEARVKFVAVDTPDLDDLTAHIFAAVGQREAELISQRTKAALTQARARGVKLGNPANLTAQARALGPQRQREAAIEAAVMSTGYAQVLREHGLSLAAIAERLNADGHRTRQGGLWRPVQVKRILDRWTAP